MVTNATQFKLRYPSAKVEWIDIPAGMEEKAWAKALIFMAQVSARQWELHSFRIEVNWKRSKPKKVKR